MGPQSHPKEKSHTTAVRTRPQASSHIGQPSFPKMHLSHVFHWTPCIYLAGIHAPLHIASTHHVLLDRVGLTGFGVDIVQAVTCLTTDKWHFKLL